jgi:glycosyltransferase involved in cell wall biosynthesis
MPSNLQVTCIMITRLNRLRFVEKSVECFVNQAYSNRDLLVLVDDCEMQSTQELDEFEQALARSAPNRVRLVRIAEKLTLGAIRNRALFEAHGDLICQWDDDDLSHPARLDMQVETLEREGAVACYLAEVLHLFEDERALYSCSWRRAPQGGHPGTGLFRAGLLARYPESGEQASRGEDTVYAMAVRQEGGIASLAGAAWLYLYRYNGANTFSREHHRQLAETMGISRSLLLRREAELRGRLAEITELDGSYEIRGSNGTAFAI